MNSTRDALYWTPSDGGSVRCGLCPHRCHIAKNAAGVCGVRVNREGALAIPYYGRVSSIALDPIEKKPLRMFHPGANILSVGGFGCNFRCKFCQNYEISLEYAKDPNNEIQADNGGRRLYPEEIIEIAIRTKPQGNIGIAYTYNEPLIGYEFVCDSARLARSAGLCNVLVTNGYISKEPLEQLLPLVDAMNIDLKGFSDSFYKKVGGALDTVMETIELARKSCHVEVTTLVIPDENEDDIEGIAKWLASVDPDIPLHLSRFFPRYKYSDKSPTSQDTILRLRDIARKRLSNVF